MQDLFLALEVRGCRGCVSQMKRGQPDSGLQCTTGSGKRASEAAGQHSADSKIAANNKGSRTERRQQNLNSLW